MSISAPSDVYISVDHRKERRIVEISIAEAESLAGRRLDRRRNYAAWDDRAPDEYSGSKVFEVARWTSDCTGCTEIGDYGTTYGPFGCDECGYTGKRRREMWVPIDMPWEKP